MNYKKVADSIKQMVVTNEDKNVEKISKLEERIKVLECGQTGHLFESYRRNDFFGSPRLRATCAYCGVEKSLSLSGLKPGQRKALIELGILRTSDFPTPKPKSAEKK